MNRFMEDRRKKVRALASCDVDNAHAMAALFTCRRQCCRPRHLSYKIDWNDVICGFHPQMSRQIVEAFLLFRLKGLRHSRCSVLNCISVLRPDFVEERLIDNSQ